MDHLMYQENGLTSPTDSKLKGLQKASDSLEKRKVQNRMAQRRYRENLRRKLEDLEARAGTETSQHTPSPVSPYHVKSPSIGTNSRIEDPASCVCSPEPLTSRTPMIDTPASEPQECLPPISYEDMVVFGNYSFPQGYTSASSKDSSSVSSTSPSDDNFMPFWTTENVRHHKRKSQQLLDTAMLHLAAKQGHQKIITILLEHGIDTSSKDTHGQTSLHVAAVNGQINAVCTLLGSGMDVDIKNDQGQTPLVLAIEHGQDAIVTLLLDHGADLHCRITGSYS